MEPVRQPLKLINQILLCLRNTYFIEMNTTLLECLAVRDAPILVFELKPPSQIYQYAQLFKTLLLLKLVLSSNHRVLVFSKNSKQYFYFKDN